MHSKPKPPVEVRNDLTQGGIINRLLLVALPVMGTQLIQMSYNLTDMFWLGRLSTAAVAASGTGGLFLWLSVAVMMIGRMGAEIGVSQHLGRGEPETARRYSENAVMLAGALGIVYGIAQAALRRQLVGFFNIPELGVVTMAQSYLGIVAVGIPFTFINAALVGTFNASGNSRTPFLVNSTGLAINMILDPLMIFGLNMGLNGAAIATVIAQAASCALLMTLTLRGGSRPFVGYKLITKWDLPILRQIVKWAAPISGESAFFTCMTMIVNRMLAQFGETVLAAIRVGSQIESLTWLVGGGFGTALVSFVGQNYGAGKWSRIRRCFALSTGVMTVYGLLTSALMALAGSAIFWIFLPDPDALALGSVALKILAVCQLPQCLETVAIGTFKGIGRTFPGSLVSVASNVLRVIMAALMVGPFGVVGVWWAVTISAAIRGVASMIWYMVESRKQPVMDADAGEVESTGVSEGVI